MASSIRPIRLAGICASAAAAVTLAACSGTATSSAPSSAASSPSSSSAATPASSSGGSFLARVDATDAAVLGSVTADSSAQSLLPASVKGAGSLSIGTQISPPETFYEPGGTQLTGDEYVLGQAIAKTLGLTPKFNVVQFDELIPGLTAGRFDMTIGAMNDTAVREKTISFVDYFDAGVGFVVKAGNPDHITGPSSLCGQSVTVQLGTTQQTFAETQSKKCTSAGKKPVTILYAQTDAQQEAEVTTGRVAAFLGDSPTAGYVSEQNPASFQQADASTPIDAAPYGIGFSKSQPQVMKAVQAALNHLIATGAYGKIMSAWSLQSGEVKTAAINGSGS